MEFILTDVSRYQTSLTCKRKRYWGFERQNPDGTRGLERTKLNLFQSTGIAIHKALARIRRGDHIEEVLRDIIGDYVREAYKREIVVEVADDLSYVISEQAALIEALCRAWSKIRLPAILSEFELLSAEEESVLELSPEVSLMFRCDTVERRREDGRIFVRNYETVAEANEAWLHKFDTDPQCISEPVAVERRTGMPIEGVLIEGLIKGRRRRLKTEDGYTYRVEQSTPLLYGYKQSTSWGDDWDWQKIAGRSERVPVWDVQTGYPGGVAEWIDALPFEALSQHFVMTGKPRVHPEIEKSWERQFTGEEERIRHARELTDGALSPPEVLDLAWPQNMTACNDYGTETGKCAFYNLCWGGLDNLNLYQPREPNHEMERKCQSQSSL